MFYLRSLPDIALCELKEHFRIFGIFLHTTKTIIVTPFG